MPKILIAEDEPDIRDLVAFTLRFAGYEVVAANNGEEAVQMASRVFPDFNSYGCPHATHDRL